jgi:hypothetical protein
VSHPYYKRSKSSRRAKISGAPSTRCQATSNERPLTLPSPTTGRGC